MNEEIQKEAARIYGACPILEWDLRLHSRRQLIEFADQQIIELRKELSDFRAKADAAVRIARGIIMDEEIDFTEKQRLEYNRFLELFKQIKL